MGSESTKPATQQQNKKSMLSLPDWMTPIANVCNYIYPYFWAFTGLAFLLVITLIAAKRTEFAWLSNAIGFMAFFASIAIIAMLVAEFESSPLPAWVTTILGILLFYTPVWMGMLVSAVKLATPDPIVEKMTNTCHVLGFLFASLSIISLMITYVFHFFVAKEQRRAIQFKYINPEKLTEKLTEKPGIIPKCWQMSRCRPSVRMTCPNFIDHVTCWKRRSGCFCDRELANFLITSSGHGEAQEAIDMQKAVGGSKVIRGHITNRKQHRSWREHRRYCVECPLFLEHQEYKYKRFSPLSFVITALIVAGIYPFFNMAYAFVLQFLKVALEETLKLPGVNIDNSLINGSFQYLLLGVLALLLLTYVISFLDKVFLEWKL